MKDLEWGQWQSTQPGYILQLKNRNGGGDAQDPELLELDNERPTAEDRNSCGHGLKSWSGVGGSLHNLVTFYNGNIETAEGLPRTLSDMQLTEWHRSRSASVESLVLYRSRSLTPDRNRASSANSCWRPGLPEELKTSLALRLTGRAVPHALY